MNPVSLILCKNFLPKRPSMPLSRLKRPDILTTIETSLNFEAYKSTTFPPIRIKDPFKHIVKELKDE